MQHQSKQDIEGVNLDIIKYLPFKFFPGLAGLATIFFLVKSFSPEEYGLYSYIISSALIVLQLGSSWIVNSTLFVFPEYQTKEHFQLEKYISIFQLYILIPLGALLAVVVYNFTGRYELALLSFLLLVIQGLSALYNGFLQANRSIGVQAKASLIQSTIQIILIYIVIFKLNYSIEYALIVLIIGLATSFCYLYFHRLKNRIIAHNISSKEIIRKVLKFGIPMGVWFFFYQIIISGDRIVMKYYHLNNELGQYSSFKDLMIGVCGFLTMPFLLASHPIIMKIWKDGGDKNKIILIMQRNVSIILLLFIPIIVLFLCVGSQVIKVVIKDKYLLSNVNMALILISILISSINLYVQKGLEVSGRTIALAVIAMLSSLIGLAFNIYLAPTYGLMAILIISIVVQICYGLFVFFYTKKILEFKFSINNILKMGFWSTFIIISYYGITGFIGIDHPYFLPSFLAIFISSLLILYLCSIEIRSLIHILISFAKNR